MTEPNLLEKYSGVRSIGLEELNRIWAHYDSDKSGYIEVGAELDRFLGDLLQAGGLEGTELELKDFRDGVLEMFDVDADGKLDFAEVEKLLND